MALRKFILFLMLLVSVPLGLFAQTATIRVRVLDGRTGKNLTRMYLAFLDYHSASDGNKQDDLNGRLLIKTGVNGDSYSMIADVHGILVFAGLGDRTGYWTTCSRQKFYDSKTRTYGDEYLYPVSAIMASGYTSKNSCSKRAAVAAPGELIVFVRPTTWWERFVAGMRE